LDVSGSFRVAGRRGCCRGIFIYGYKILNVQIYA
jgi:hypothetical protein